MVPSQGEAVLEPGAAFQPLPPCWEDLPESDH